MVRRYEGTTAYAARHGITEREALARAKSGSVGAVQIGGPRSAWRYPVDEVGVPARIGLVARLDPGAGTPDPEPWDRVADERTRTATVDLIATARGIAARVETVTTRPARALTTAAYEVAAIGSSHQPSRDGLCARCGWSWPCDDRSSAAALLEHLAAIVGGTE